MRGLAGWIVIFAGVNVTKTCVHATACHVQRLRRCRRPVHQLPVRMKAVKCNDTSGAEIPPPSTLRLLFGGESFSPGMSRVVISNQTLVMLEVLEGLEQTAERFAQ